MKKVWIITGIVLLLVVLFLAFSIHTIEDSSENATIIVPPPIAVEIAVEVEPEPVELPTEDTDNQTIRATNDPMSKVNLDELRKLKLVDEVLEAHDNVLTGVTFRGEVTDVNISDRIITLQKDGVAWAIYIREGVEIPEGVAEGALVTIGAVIRRTGLLEGSVVLMGIGPIERAPAKKSIRETALDQIMGNKVVVEIKMPGYGVIMNGRVIARDGQTITVEKEGDTLSIWMRDTADMRDVFEGREVTVYGVIAVSGRLEGQIVSVK